MNGTVVQVLIGVGDRIQGGDSLMVLEAMKMEHAIKSPSAGVAREIFYAEMALI
jgi:3-methylcrotonyl-CoA carboxylase alpha subunit